MNIMILFCLHIHIYVYSIIDLPNHQTSKCAIILSMKYESTSLSLDSGRTSHREETSLRYQLRDPDFKRFIKEQDLRIHACETVTGKAGDVCMDQIYFIGVNVLYCDHGSFKLTFSDHSPIEMVEGDVMIVFPNRFVSFKATAKKSSSTIYYTIISGGFAEEYVSSVGFYDFCKFSCSYPEGSMLSLQRILETKDVSTEGPRTEALCIFHSMLLSLIEQAKMRGDAYFFDAIKAINKNLFKGICRIKPVCDELGVCRAQLQRIFVRNGFNGASAFIKHLQLQYAIKLLGLSRLSISEIAFRCGFLSPTQFSAFIRKRTGKPPTQLRSNTTYSPVRVDLP